MSFPFIVNVFVLITKILSCFVYFILFLLPQIIRGSHGHDHVVVVSSNPVHGEVYSIQHYVTAGRWFSLHIPVSSTNKIDRQDIHVTEILLKVALDTTTLTL